MTSQAISPAAYTLLSVFKSRQLFAGDELRIASLRRLWLESERPIQDFPRALAQLNQAGYLKAVRGTTGPAMRLTALGFKLLRQGTKKKRSTAQKVSPISRAVGMVAEKQPKSPGALSLSPYLETGTIKLSSSVCQEKETLNNNILRHTLLGLFRHHRTHPGGQLSYECLLKHWEEMELAKADFLLALDLLIRDGCMQSHTKPDAHIRLTTRGHRLNMKPAEGVDDGRDRWLAGKLLRKTKRLGEMPAA